MPLPDRRDCTCCCHRQGAKHVRACCVLRPLVMYLKDREEKRRERRKRHEQRKKEEVNDQP